MPSIQLKPQCFVLITVTKPQIILEYVMGCIFRYDLLEIESNSRQYFSRGEVPASDDLKKLAWSLGKEMSEKGKPGSQSGFL